MTNRSLHSRILNIFLDNNILRHLHYILFIFVVSSIVYNHQINAIDETNADDFQNSSSEKLQRNNDLRIINYSNLNITNLTNNNEDSIYSQIAAFENNVYVVWQESVTKSFPEHNYDIFFIKSEDKGETFSIPINVSNNSQNSNNQEISAFDENVYVVWREQDRDQNNNTDKGNDSIIFKNSIDNGNNFNDPIELATNT